MGEEEDEDEFVLELERKRQDAYERSKSMTCGMCQEAVYEKYEKKKKVGFKSWKTVIV